MIQIAKNNLDRFKRNNCEYLYYVSRGVFLAFDLDTLEFIGIELYFLPADYKIIDKKCDKKLKELLSKGILELSYND